MTALHQLPARVGNVHWGYFDAALAPALRVNSGDLIRAEAVTHHAGDAPDLMMDAADLSRSCTRRSPSMTARPACTIMTGSDLRRSHAAPGDMLEVRYHEMTPRLDYGSNLAAHRGHLYREMQDRERVTIYRLHREANQATAMFAYDVKDKYLVPGRITDCAACDCQPALQGIRIPTRPHLGTAGVAPDAKGRVSSVPPGKHGGNIDNWRIGAGATMYYPVQVPGALFSVGDPHVSQGDGEISGTAIEASLDVLFEVRVRKDFQFPSPLLETPLHWIVHGFNEDLNVAMRDASLDMLTLLTDHRGLSRDDAYSLMSVAAGFCCHAGSGRKASESTAASGAECSAANRQAPLAHELHFPIVMVSGERSHE